MTRFARLKRSAHRLIDPLAALPNALANRRRLRDLSDGEYRLPPDVPYVPQFASPEHIYAYIHEGFHGRNDPAWASFGAPDEETYDFWARRVCALACLKMSVVALRPDLPPPTLWQLVERGLAFKGYRAFDEQGRLVDEGWFYTALVSLADEYGLESVGRGYVAAEEICRFILDGWLVAPSVTPELGEHGPLRRYGGHMVLAYGFTWKAGRLESLLLHNPSGRYADLQAGAVIPARRFRAAFAHRLMAFRPARRYSR